MKITISFRRLCIALIGFYVPQVIVAQSIEHPHIWVSESDKAKILSNIENYDWAKSMYDQLVQRNKDTKDIHIDNLLPSGLLRSVKVKKILISN